MPIKTSARGYADATFLKKTGDTATGNYIFNGSGVNIFQVQNAGVPIFNIANYNEVQVLNAKPIKFYDGPNSLAVYQSSTTSYFSATGALSFIGGAGGQFYVHNTFLFQSETGYLHFISGPNQHQYFDCGGYWYWRDVDASSVNKMTLGSQNGDLSLIGYQQITTPFALTTLTLNQQSTGGIFDCQDNAISVFNVYDGGAVVVNETGTATGDFRAEGDTDVNLLMVDASADKVGIGTATPTMKLSVNEAGGITPEGGYAVKMTAAEALVKGEVVYINQAGADNVVTKNPINGDMPVGIVYADAAINTAVWIVTSGIAAVLPNAADTAARGYVIYSSSTTAGRVNQAATIPAIAEHMRECGHFIANGTGAGVLTKAFIHFN